MDMDEVKSYPVRVTFYPLNAPDDDNRPFQRQFPDLATWYNVRDGLRWTYAALVVEECVDGVWMRNEQESEGRVWG